MKSNLIEGTICSKRESGGLSKCCWLSTHYSPHSLFPGMPEVLAWFYLRTFSQSRSIHGLGWNCCWANPLNHECDILDKLRQINISVSWPSNITKSETTPAGTMGLNILVYSSWHLSGNQSYILIFCLVTLPRAMVMKGFVKGYWTG